MQKPQLGSQGAQLLCTS